jgi:hypothetical protein
VSASTDEVAAKRRDRIARLLRERGVDNVVQLMMKYSDDEADGWLGAIALYDDMQKGFNKPGPGLLVKKINEGGIPGYKRAHERTEVEGSIGGVNEDLLRSIRGQCLGAFMSREQARDHFRGVSRRLDTAVDALLDSAMGQGWLETPPHPGDSFSWRMPWRYPSDGLAWARYCFSTQQRRAAPSDVEAVRAVGESDWAFACRYWGWVDPEGLADGSAIEAAREKRRLEAVAEEEARTAHYEASRIREAEKAASLAARVGPVEPEQTALLATVPRSAIDGESGESYVPTPGTDRRTDKSAGPAAADQFEDGPPLEEPHADDLAQIDPGGPIPVPESAHLDELPPPSPEFTAEDAAAARTKALQGIGTSDWKAPWSRDAGEPVDGTQVVDDDELWT